MRRDKAVTAYYGESDESYNWFYKRMNKTFFSGKLPKDVVVFSCHLRPGKFGGLLRRGSINDIEHQAVILISDTIGETQALLTVLHEMNHLYLPPTVNHGPAFQKGMLRLAKLGAFNGLW
jgi:hypothetical protein